VAGFEVPNDIIEHEVGDLTDRPVPPRVEVPSSPQSSSAMAVTYLVLMPCTYRSALVRIIARSLHIPRPFSSR